MITAPTIPRGIAQGAPYTPPRTAPAAPIIAQYGDRAVAIIFGITVAHPNGLRTRINSSTLIRSEKLERKYARIITIFSNFQTHQTNDNQRETL
jgi:hypothetical protein